MNKVIQAFAGVVFTGLLGLLTTTADAQILSRGDLFGPGAPPPMIGLELGVGAHQQVGTFQAACGCSFETGDGKGFLGNVVFELPVNYEVAFGVKAGIDFKNTSGVAYVHDTSVIRFVRNGDSLTTTGRVDFNRNGNVSTTYLDFTPYARYQFYRDGPFVQVGPSVGILMSNHFTHTRELQKTTATLEDGTTIDNIKFENGTREETLEDGPVTNAKSIRLAALLTGGYDFAVSERSVMSPMFTIDLPLSTIRDDAASGWKMMSFYASVALKFKLD